MPMRKDRGLNIFLVTVSLIVGLLLCESAVRMMRPSSDIFPAHPAADPILGIRLLPFQSGHDGKGFRNDTAEGYFPIVFIGDSVVYGIGIPRPRAIPQQLSRMIEKPVYNMGLGSYGPVQYYQLYQESREMHPQKTIISLFMGNDILDAYFLVADHDYWQWLLPEMGTDHQLDHIPLCSLPYQRKYREDPYLTPGLITIQLKESGSLLWQVHSFLRLHSALYALQYEGLVKPVVQRIFERQKHLQQPGAFHSPVLDTIFIPEANLRCLDLRDARVRQGLLITKKIVEMLGGLQKNKDDLLFTIIPTKEYVYYDFLKSRNVILTPEFECAVHYEREITGWLINLITANGFPVVDVLPALKDAAAEGGMLYHSSSDAHPHVAGNRVIATTLLNALKDKLH